MTVLPVEDARHRMARTLLASGYSVEQAAERTGLPRRLVQELTDEHRRTPEELLSELRDLAGRLPGREPDVIAEKYAATIPPDAQTRVLILALSLLLRTGEQAEKAPANIPAHRSYRPPQPSRKTQIVKDLVQARLETRVVVNGQQLRFGDCTRDQVDELYDRTKDAAAALMAHAVWLRKVSESMLMHRAATVGELPVEPRAALMEAKPE